MPKIEIDLKKTSGTAWNGRKTGLEKGGTGKRVERLGESLK